MIEFHTLNAYAIPQYNIIQIGEVSNALVEEPYKAFETGWVSLLNNLIFLLNLVGSQKEI